MLVASVETFLDEHFLHLFHQQFALDGLGNVSDLSTAKIGDPDGRTDHAAHAHAHHDLCHIPVSPVLRLGLPVQTGSVQRLDHIDGIIKIQYLLFVQREHDTFERERYRLDGCKRKAELILHSHSLAEIEYWHLNINVQFNGSFEYIYSTWRESKSINARDNMPCSRLYAFDLNNHNENELC